MVHAQGVTLARPMVLKLLEFFMRHPGQYFTAKALHERIWHCDYSDASLKTVRAHIKLLRRSVDVPGQQSIIETRLPAGAGYGAGEDPQAVEQICS